MPQPVKTRLMAKEISALAGAPWLRRRAFWSAWPVVLPVEGLGPGVNTGLQDDSAPSRDTQNSPGLGLHTRHRQTDGRSGTEPTLKILSTAKVGSSLFLMLPGPALCPAPSKHWQHVFFRTNEQQLNKTLNNIQRLKSPTLRRQLTATRGLIGHLGEHTSCLDVREGPVLKKKRQQSR